MVQSHASNGNSVFKPQPSVIWVLCVLGLVILAILIWGGPKARQYEFRLMYGHSPQQIVVPCYQDHDIGVIMVVDLNESGELRLGFGHPAGTFTYPQMLDTLNLEWWQIVEREDRHGYPRIDPQSGGSGLPGARGEDEDPAYYSKANLEDPELRPRIFAEGKYWLLDRPSLENSIRCESWLVHRTGPKAVTFITGVSWGITAQDGKPLKLHHPQQITQRSRYDWHESLRISGFGSGWDLKTAYHSTLP